MLPLPRKSILSQLTTQKHKTIYDQKCKQKRKENWLIDDYQSQHPDNIPIHNNNNNSVTSNNSNNNKSRIRYQRNPSQSLFDNSSNSINEVVTTKNNNQNQNAQSQLNTYALIRSSNSIVFSTALYYFSQKCYYPQEDNVLFRFIKKYFQNYDLNSTHKIQLNTINSNSVNLSLLCSSKSIEEQNQQILKNNTSQGFMKKQEFLHNQIKFAPFNAKNILRKSNIEHLLKKINECLKEQKNVYYLLHENYEFMIFLSIVTRQYAISYYESHVKKYKDESMGNQIEILENYEIQPRNLPLTIIMDSLGIQLSYQSQIQSENNREIQNFTQKFGDQKNRLKFQIKSSYIRSQLCYQFTIAFNDSLKNKSSKLNKRQKSSEHNKNTNQIIIGRSNANSLYINSNLVNQNAHKGNTIYFVNEPMSPRSHINRINNRNINAALSPKKKYQIPFQEIQKQSSFNIIKNTSAHIPKNNIKKSIQHKFQHFDYDHEGQENEIIKIDHNEKQLMNSLHINSNQFLKKKIAKDKGAFQKKSNQMITQNKNSLKHEINLLLSQYKA